MEYNKIESIEDLDEVLTRNEWKREFDTVQEDEVVFKGGRKVFTPSAPKDKQLNEADMIFINGVMAGNTNIDSFIEAYPERAKNKSRAYLSALCTEILSRPKFKAELEKRTQRVRELATDKGLWTYEMATETLKNTIGVAEGEIRRNEMGIQMRLDTLRAELADAIEEEDMEKCQRTTKSIHDLMTRKQLSRNTVSAVVESVKTLNEMYGFNGDDVSLANAVMIEGTFSEIVDNPEDEDFVLHEEDNIKAINQRIEEVMKGEAE